jgi:hypothetical protein
MPDANSKALVVSFLTRNEAERRSFQAIFFFIGSLVCKCICIYIMYIHNIYIRNI